MALRDDSNVRPHEELTSNEARQGVTGHNVRYVLGISIATAILAMIIVSIFVIQA